MAKNGMNGNFKPKPKTQREFKNKNSKMNTWGHTVLAQNGEFGKPKSTPNSRFPWEVQLIRIDSAYSKIKLV